MRGGGLKCGGRSRVVLAVIGGIHNPVQIRRNMETQKERQCNLALVGWRCTRNMGHDGPCAAIQITEESKPVQAQCYMCRGTGKRSIMKWFGGVQHWNDVPCNICNSTGLLPESHPESLLLRINQLEQTIEEIKNLMKNYRSY